MMMDPKDTIVTKDVIPDTVVRDSALRKERIDDGRPGKDRGAKNDEHEPEGANPTPGGSEWTENLFIGGDWRVSANAWAGFGLRLLLICGTLFSVFQYLAARQEMRVERTFQLVDVWERSEYQDAQRAVNKRIAALVNGNPSPFGANPTDAQIDMYYSRIGLAALAEDGGEMPLAEFEDQFGRVVYFLNRVAYCVDSRICDRDVADAFFQDYARVFWRYFHGYVEKQRGAGNKTYAEAIEKYAAGNQVAATAAH